MRVPGSISRATALNHPSPTASHRPHEVGRIGGGERLVDEPGRLPVGLQRDPHGIATHQPRIRRLWIATPGADSSLLVTHRKEGLMDGLTGSHPDGNPIPPPMITCYQDVLVLYSSHSAKNRLDFDPFLNPKRRPAS